MTASFRSPSSIPLALAVLAVTCAAGAFAARAVPPLNGHLNSEHDPSKEIYFNEVRVVDGTVEATTAVDAGESAGAAAETAAATASKPRRREFNAFKAMPGHDRPNDHKSPLPHTYVKKHKLPKHFSWANVSGVNYLTKSLNQHIPQYCGSCWAHGAMSALADRIKIANGPKNRGPDSNLAIQHILNCGTEVAGSCHGGMHSGAYQFVKDTGYIPFDTCLQYEACSSESAEGRCAGGDFTCSAMNTCRTCSTFSDMGGFCSALDTFPNASIAEYGVIAGEHAIMAEIYARGPVAAGVDADPLHDYTGGVYKDNPPYEINHIVSIVGWGETHHGIKYWIVRNSWGEYWGEMGFFRVIRGVKALGIEDSIAWATPATWTKVNFPCYEDGTNCVENATYVDPSQHGVPLGEKHAAA